MCILKDRTRKGLSMTALNHLLFFTQKISSKRYSKNLKEDG